MTWINADQLARIVKLRDGLGNYHMDINPDGLDQDVDYDEDTGEIEYVHSSVTVRMRGQDFMIDDEGKIHGEY